MKFPSLVKKQFCKTPVEVTIYGEGITEDGSPVIAFECKNLYPSENLYPSNILCGGNAVCNVQSKANIAPDSPTLSGGFVILDGVKRNIVQSIKHRNPDGTVNFTELDVI